jgi:hypothetical protein
MQELAREKTIQAQQAAHNQRNQNYNWTKGSQSDQHDNNNTKKRPAPPSLTEYMQKKKMAAPSTGHAQLDPTGKKSTK